MGLSRAGFDVVGIDIVVQKNYPCGFLQADALTYDLTGFDFVWASPPCQAYCAMKTMPNKREHPKLIEAVRDKLKKWGGPWIIENVHGAPLKNALMLCGSMFGLESNGYQLRRHRYFESNIRLTGNGMTCQHAKRTLGVYGGKVRDIAKEKRHYALDKATRGKPDGVVLPQAWGLEAMGCEWMKIREASEAIPPIYSEFLGDQMLKADKERWAASERAKWVRKERKGAR